jgi:hypothetical protein
LFFARHLLDEFLLLGAAEIPEGAAVAFFAPLVERPQAIRPGLLLLRRGVGHDEVNVICHSSSLRSWGNWVIGNNRVH